MKKIRASPIVHAAILLGSSGSSCHTPASAATAFHAGHQQPVRCARRGLERTRGDAHEERRQGQQNEFRSMRTRPTIATLRHAKRRGARVVDDVDVAGGAEEGVGAPESNPGGNRAGTIDDERDDDPASDVDQEPKKRPRTTKKASRKAKGKDDDDDAAADEDLLHWILDTDRAVVRYRALDDTSALANGLSVSDWTRNNEELKTRRVSKQNATIVTTSSAAPLIQPVAASALTATSVRFVVRGPPRPLVRHRVSTFRMYNPSAKAQKSFQGAVRTLLSNARAADHNHQNVQGATSVPLTPIQGGVGDGGESLPVLFPTESLAIMIAFRMKRPLNHFMANRREEGRLKGSAPPQTFVTRTDVDNLAKFVLDSLNGLLYDDDRQVCSLHATKILDNDGLCLGSTEVGIRVLDDRDVPRLLDASFRLFGGDDDDKEKTDDGPI